MIEKICSRCKEAKPATPAHFPAHKQKKDGLAPHCKPCIQAWDRARRPATTGLKKGVRTLRSVIKANYRARHPERVKAQQQQQYRKRYDSGAILAANKAKYRDDPQFNMLTRLRARTRKALFGVGKKSTTRELLGCTPDELRLWMETFFTEGMSWENMSEWEIDHIRPFASFDLSDPEQLRQAAHYRNLQPLWRADNRKKKAKWP